ncbi:MAG: bifunctional DNA primase/polymerase [Solidesulfovibrio sp. DCME]|uniref:bifunctional DNA primase/polymerase n=1 Tax=Solidesulfovibrio sp. DCME TaxID=3447380 RepID=UPI003D120A49
MLNDALNYARRGHPVFPCGIDKKPLVQNGFHAATTDEEQIRSWWEKWPNASIGIPTGPDIDAFVLDIDLPDGPNSLATLEAKHGPLPSTLEQTTGSGGCQLFFKWPKAGPGVRNSVGKLGLGLDIRGAGGYVIVPPSGHPSGGHYTWKKGHVRQRGVNSGVLEVALGQAALGGIWAGCASFGWVLSSAMASTCM